MDALNCFQLNKENIRFESTKAIFNLDTSFGTYGSVLNLFYLKDLHKKIRAKHHNGEA